MHGFIPPQWPAPIGPSTLPPAALPFIPEGYAANITHLPSGMGPPIAAIVLRKKRRRRSRQTNSTIAASESPGCSLPTEGSRSPESETRNDIGGSCPDLSQDQLQDWDNILFDAASASNSNGYDIPSKRLVDLAAQAIDGISNSHIRKLDNELNGMTSSMTSSMVMQRLAEHGPHFDANGSLEKSLASELEQVHFRLPETRYGYPQVDDQNVQLATFHPDGVRTKMIKRNRLMAESDSEGCEEDCFEGMNITVNAFDACEELTLSDVESASATRFEQIQKALKRNSQKVAELRPPDRVCCSIS